MTRPIAVSVLVIASVIFSHGRPVAAQGVASGYRPTTPTFSPWLNLYQRGGQGGPLDPYHQFVRPELDLRETLRQQGITNQRQGDEVSSLDQQVTQMEADRLATIRPTGAGSVFMNYSHFYPGSGATGQMSRAPSQSSHAWSPKPAKSAESMRSGGRGF